MGETNRAGNVEYLMPDDAGYGVGDLAHYDGVRRRRMLAFVVDYVIVAILVVLAAIANFFFGIVTFGLGWLLYAVLAPLVAMAYVGITMGGPHQATMGMQMFSIRIERLDDGRVDPMLAVLHGVLFWVGHITLTPLLLVVSLFSHRKQLLHDMLLGTVIVRSDISELHD